MLIYLQTEKKYFFLKIVFQNSIQDWVFLLWNGPKKVLRINPVLKNKVEYIAEFCGKIKNVFVEENLFDNVVTDKAFDIHVVNVWDDNV